MFYIGQSVRIEPRSLQHNLEAANLTIGEYEQLLMRHGVVVEVFDGGLYSVMFKPLHNDASQNVGYNINEAGLRVVWQVGQRVRANAHFYNDTRRQMLQSADVRVQDLMPLGNFDVTGIVQSDVGSGKYAVIMRLPSTNNNVEPYELQIDSDQLRPVWEIGDHVHLISFLSANGRQQIQTQFPNTHIEEIRAWVFRIHAAADNIYEKYYVSTLPPGQANPLAVKVHASTLQSSGPARIVEMDDAGAYVVP